MPCSKQAIHHPISIFVSPVKRHARFRVLTVLFYLYVCSSVLCCDSHASPLLPAALHSVTFTLGFVGRVELWFIFSRLKAIVCVLFSLIYFQPAPSNAQLILASHHPWFSLLFSHFLHQFWAPTHARFLAISSFFCSLAFQPFSRDLKQLSGGLPGFVLAIICNYYYCLDIAAAKLTLATASLFVF